MRIMLLCCFGLIISGEIALAEMRVERDIAYAHQGDSSHGTSLDVYAPQAGERHPVMVWIHGGAWRIGDKRAVQEKPRAFVAQQFVFVSINYRLYPGANYKEQASDVARAVRWVHDHIGKYGGDPRRMFIMGHSAGAHLAALVATDARYLHAERLKLGAIKGAILLDGAGYDIPRQVRWSLGKSKQLYTTVFGEDQETQRDASPITHVAEGRGIPPFLIVHVADRVGSKMQSNWLADTLRQANVEATVYAARDKTHATVNREFGTADDPPTKQAFAFLNDRLGRRRSTSAEKTTDLLRQAHVTIDGLKRKYLLFVPESNQPMPLVFVLHGGGGNVEHIVATQFHTLAQRERFIVCYPTAVEKNWNDGRNVRFLREHRDNIDDVQFIRTLIDEIAQRHPVDRSRVFSTGASNGAIMSHRLAAEASDVIAAIAPVIGGMAVPVAGDFNPQHPVSLFVIQGDADPLVPFDGGGIGLGRRRGEVISTMDAVAKYVQLNGIHGEPTVSMVQDADPEDGTTTKASVYPPGVDGSKVQVYVVHHGGHTWPGRPPYAAERLIGQDSQDFDATQAIWEFFASCPPRRLASQ